MVMKGVMGMEEVTNESEGWQIVCSRKRSNGQRCVFNENDNGTCLAKETQVVVLVANQVSAKEVQSNGDGGDSESKPTDEEPREEKKNSNEEKRADDCVRETVHMQLPIELDVREQVQPLAVLDHCRRNKGIEVLIHWQGDSPANTTQEKLDEMQLQVPHFALEDKG
jgi:hypothetical protein